MTQDHSDDINIGFHNNDVIMDARASQITSITIF